METSPVSEPYPWLKFYPEGVPYEINPDQYASVLALMDDGFNKFADWPACSNLGKELTFRQVDKLSRQFAAYLQQELKLQKGDRVVIQMPNLLQYPIALFGVLRAGLTVVNTNPLYTPREMSHQFKDAGAKAIVILANFAANLEKIVNETQIEHVIVTEIGDLFDFPKRLIVNAVVKYVKKMVPTYQLPKAISFREALNRGHRHRLVPMEMSGQDIAFIQYTGGTTGISKGAMLSHRNIVANVEMLSTWFRAGIPATDKQDIIVAALPLYHIYALTVNILSALRIGYMNLLITNPRDLKSFSDELKRYKFTIITGVNTLYNNLLNYPHIREIDFSHLKIASAGGMALQTSVAERWRELTGLVIAEGYGLSETSPVLSSNPVVGPIRLGTIGIPFPNTEMKIMQEDGTEAPIGNPGEIWARGPQVFLGYFNRPDETAKVMEGEWFKTGDVGVMDGDGFFRVVDRIKDLILVSGFNVYPSEIEDVIALCPGVKEVACIGVPDEKSTEAVKLYIVKNDPNLTEQTLKEYCRENLTNYKRPRYIEFRDSLPKTNIGKILRRKLKEEESEKSAEA